VAHPTISATLAERRAPPRTSASRCLHRPRCPSAGAPDRAAARTLASHPEQGWHLLCNGVVLFEDGGELLPDGSSVEPSASRIPMAAIALFTG
jgi:hypothetical protein